MGWGCIFGHTLLLPLLGYVGGGGYPTKGEGNGREFLGKRGGILLNKGVHRGGATGAPIPMSPTIPTGPFLWRVGI